MFCRWIHPLLVLIFATHILQLLSGCVSCYTKEPGDLPKLTVLGNTILSGDRPYAELRFYGTARLTDNRGEAHLFARETQHRGIAVYYFGDRALIWIYPDEESWKDDIDSSYGSQTQGHFGWVSDVTISEDGQQIYYRTPALMSTSSWEYSVVDRTLRRIGREWYPGK